MARKSCSFLVVPQRASMGWTSCEPHQAQRWSVQRVTMGRVNGKTYRTLKQLAAFKTQDEAEYFAGRCQRGAASGTGLPTLGQRFPATGRKIIAASLPLKP